MTAIDDVPCPECGRPFGQHTLVEYREHTATHLPFGPVDSPTFNDLSPGQVIVDHLDIAASVLMLRTELAGVLHIPAVEFRFHSSDGTRPPPILFVADIDDAATWKSLGRLLVGACGAAPLRARQAARQYREGGGQ